MVKSIKINKDILLFLLISIFLTIFFLYLIFNILDMSNPIFAEEDCSILTPKLKELLMELEQKFK